LDRYKVARPTNPCGRESKSSLILFQSNELLGQRPTAVFFDLSAVAEPLANVGVAHGTPGPA